MVLNGNDVHQPPYSFSQVAQKDIDKNFGKGKNAIPAEYIGVLPGIPVPPLVRRIPHPTRGNDTELPSGVEFNKLEEVDGYSDAELDRWMEEYMELVRESKQSTNTVAPRTEARATPTGQGKPTATAAFPGSQAGVGMPEPTS
ncbi:hypothetical protein OQA88_8191 [Cercophora sp. LCS_1]